MRSTISFLKAIQTSTVMLPLGHGRSRGSNFSLPLYIFFLFLLKKNMCAFYSYDKAILYINSAPNKTGIFLLYIQEIASLSNGILSKWNLDTLTHRGTHTDWCVYVFVYSSKLLFVKYLQEFYFPRKQQMLPSAGEEWFSYPQPVWFCWGAWTYGQTNLEAELSPGT